LTAGYQEQHLDLPTSTHFAKTVTIFTSHLLSVVLLKGKKSVAGKRNSLPAETLIFCPNCKNISIFSHAEWQHNVSRALSLHRLISHFSLWAALLGQMQFPPFTLGTPTPGSGAALSLPLKYITHIWKMDEGSVFTIKAQ